MVGLMSRALSSVHFLGLLSGSHAMDVASGNSRSVGKPSSAGLHDVDRLKRTSKKAYAAIGYPMFPHCCEVGRVGSCVDYLVGDAESLRHYSISSI